MSAQMVITHAPDEYLPSDGMTPCQFRMDPWGRPGCATVGTPVVAVHVLVESLPVGRAGTHLCAYHSPYDVRTVPVAPARGVSLGKTTDATPAPAPVAPHPDAVVHRPTVVINGVPCWDRVWETPRADIVEWITDLLAEGEYAHASCLSAYLHGPAPVLPEGVTVYPTA